MIKYLGESNCIIGRRLFKYVNIDLMCGGLCFHVLQQLHSNFYLGSATGTSCAYLDKLFQTFVTCDTRMIMCALLASHGCFKNYAKKKLYV